MRHHYNKRFRRTLKDFYLDLCSQLFLKPGTVVGTINYCIYESYRFRPTIPDVPAFFCPAVVPLLSRYRFETAKPLILNGLR